ncbi:hypothetical protein SBA2_260105 [Acidobacteriia bacterium SbA2]|nr:hypothetical protein SBA2_260105 [Acidobacteriia bacterium SbA2]
MSSVHADKLIAASALRKPNRPRRSRIGEVKAELFLHRRPLAVALPADYKTKRTPRRLLLHR